MSRLKPSSTERENTPVRIAITTGEPAGIGPELTAQAFVRGSSRWHRSVHFTVLGDRRLLIDRAKQVGIDPSVWSTSTSTGAPVVIHNIPLNTQSVAGVLNTANSPYVLEMLDTAITGALNGIFDAIVTAPLQKSTINKAGVLFTGHTEYLAKRTSTPRVVMMLSGTGKRPLRVALATTHLSLRDVPNALNIDGLVDTLVIIDRDLRERFCIASPRILVTGLNPHAGENGYLGREEIEVITPAVQRARASGVHACGPYPADTLFQPRHLNKAECILAMYHDQGLPVLKFATFGKSVNVTLGLPIIRTSVDHGTALDLAGTGYANCGSLIAAIETAISMASTAAMRVSSN
ncbi:4-hydroxythreonine-4-phosphate dehydrogenase PdxA [Candidatus Vallotia lariciata]|uniref:4-hydroxythreonine-4-phosphate dehydrogenase PdxA n=1 Tax=Candidatus Vallotia laricis TaxID=2018052 RepID=UPI001D004A10|nr:4-hydroxythreonine-4-phosphate dehydrogenase PdxA [Candidatus Vallotia lariciata]UDG83286.1 4-hydroxythreonine-4-phosphate dehydrogenase [Candidatus Vallotia lariciata]